MISRVLIAYDATPSSEKALDLGLDIAEKYAAPAHVVNVMELPVFGSPDDPLAVSAGTKAAIGDLRRTHEQFLYKAKETAAKRRPNIKITTELREGNPPREIVAAAVEGKFDIIVLGHAGEGRVREFFLGGTSERVAHQAPCAVLIVK